MLVTGASKCKEQRIKKPCLLGAFVTAYSRKLMLFFIKEIDPTLKTCMFTYTDTDILHIKGAGYQKLVEKGYIVPKTEANLGYMCSDIKDEGVIIYEKNLSPKTYCYEYLTNKDELGIDDLCTMKAKGIPNRCLKQEYYKDNEGHEVEFSGLKKIHKKITTNRKMMVFQIFQL